MTQHTPRVVFLPFEWDGFKWVKCDTLPRFKEDYEAVQFLQQHPEVSIGADKQPRYLRWIECWESAAINEFLKGVGTPEWVARQNN